MRQSVESEVLRAIAFLCDRHEGKTRAGAATIATQAGVSRDSVFASIPKLETAGHLQVERGTKNGVRVNWYTITPAGREALAHPGGVVGIESRLVGNVNSDPGTTGSSGTERTGTTSGKPESESGATALQPSAPADDWPEPLGPTAPDWLVTPSRKLAEALGDDLAKFLDPNPDAGMTPEKCDLCGARAEPNELKRSRVFVGRLRGTWWIHKDGTCDSALSTLVSRESHRLNGWA